MLASERLIYITDTVNRDRVVNLKDISCHLGVSQTTIRRDLEKLECEGKLIRVHGGAKKIDNSAILSTGDELSMFEKLTINAQQKKDVCQRAASFVKDGDCIFVDGGTSLAPLFDCLCDKHVKIVTHNLLAIQTASAAFASSAAEIIFIGGKYVQNYSMSVGPIALNTLKYFNFDHAFIGCAGVDLDKQSVYTAEMDTFAVKEAAMQRAVNKYLLVDTSKFNIHGFCSFSDFSIFDAIICNNDDNLKNYEIPDSFILV